MFAALRRPNRPRRGVTLVEMLVVVALVVLMMVILVQIFQAATGAMTASRTTQELDVVLRQIDSTIRSDLGGVTAQMTPPNDPARKTGYFEYAENAPADPQGEDTDDWIAFTTKAPEGQVFTGRQYLTGTTSGNISGGATVNNAIQPITITSQVAEVIYFLRNGNLYRRVFLVAPGRTKSIASSGPGFAAGSGRFQTSMFGPTLTVSWLGVNDISCRPGGISAAGNVLPPIPNDLGDLTNRENRAFRPRFLNDFKPGDGIADDNNADGLPDYYPTLYFDGVGRSYKDANNNPIWSPNQFTNEVPGYSNSNITPNFPRVEQKTGNSYDVYAFPFIYPGMYSVPDPNRVNTALGWVHYPAHTDAGGLINHAPLDVGEPTNPPNPVDFTTSFLPVPNAQQPQTWWGFPTWRETMSGVSSGGGVGWRDPISFVSGNADQQPLGLRPFSPLTAPTLTSTNFLPPIYRQGTSTAPFSFDGAGSSSFVSDPLAAGSKQSLYPDPIWEDDLILTGVRSFDVKAYDPNAPLYNLTSNATFSAGYQDLGYGSLNYNPANAGYLNTNYANASTLYGPNGKGATTQISVPFQAAGSDPVGFGHEGRIPPIFSDFRPDPRRGYNIGDDLPGVIRLTHTFDTWSTAYTNAPDSDIFLHGSPISGTTPIYPAFPPPYTSPLRGIQIQIRVVDPRNERSKVLTIRHDFTDKLTN